MRLTRRQLLVAAGAASIVAVRPGLSRRRHVRALDLRYATPGVERAPLPVATLVLDCPVRMPSGNSAGDQYFSELVAAIGEELQLPLIGVGPVDWLKSLRVRGSGGAERAGTALERLLDAPGVSLSWELLRGPASGLYSLVLRRMGT